MTLAADRRRRHRLAVGVAWAGAVTALLALAAVTALVWRLSLGPLSLDFLVPRIEAAIVDADPTLAVEIGGLTLSWGNRDRPLDLSAGDLVVRTHGAEIARIATVSVGLAAGDLLRGRLRLTRIGLVAPRLALRLAADGTVRLRIGGADDTAGGGVFDPRDFLFAAPGEDGTLAGRLETITIEDAALEVDDRRHRERWRARADELTVTRSAAGLSARVRLAVAVGATATTRVAGDLAWARADDAGTLAVELRSLPAAALVARLGDRWPLPAGLGLHGLPVSAGLALGFGRDRRPETVSFGVEVGPGRVTLDAGAPVADAPGGGGAPAAVRLVGLSAAGQVRLDGGRLRLAAVDATFAAPALRLSAHGDLAPIGDGIGAVGGIELAGRDGTIAALDLELWPTDLQAAADPGHDLAVGVRALRLDRAAATITATPPLNAVLGDSAAYLSGLGFDLEGRAELRLTEAWTPDALTLEVTGGPGTLAVPGQLPDPVTVRGLSIAASGGALADPAARRLAVDRLALAFDGPTLRAEATVVARGDTLALAARAEAEAVPAEALDRLWPRGIGIPSRKWITENISVGVVDRASIAFEGTAPRADPAAIEPILVDGRIAARDLTVRYFKPLPPVVGIATTATIDQRRMVLDTVGGRLRDLEVGNGRVVISGLEISREDIDITVPVSGPIPTMLAILDRPPLGYAAKFDIVPETTAGTARTRLNFRFPLIEELETDLIAVTVAGELTGAAVPDVAAGFDVTDGRFRLDLDNDQLRLDGTARVDGLAATVSWHERFGDAVEVPTAITAAGTVDARDFTRVGVELVPHVTGPIGTALEIRVDRAGTPRIDASLDLTPAVVTLSPFGWQKPTGRTGSARFEVVFDRDVPARLLDLSVAAADLQLAGSVTLAPRTAAFERLSMTKFRLGETDVQGEVRARAGGGYDVEVHGQRFDLRPLLGSGDAAAPVDPATAPGGPAAAPIPVAVHGQVERLITAADDRGVAAAVGGAFYDGTRLRQVGGTAVLPRGGRIQVSYGGEAGADRLVVDADNAGGAFAALGISDGMRGGRLSIAGAGPVAVPGQTLAGQVELRDFVVEDAPLLARVLNAISVGGLIDLLSGEGLRFDRLVGGWQLTDGVLALEEIRASGSALGLTVDGEVDLRRGKLALRGTVVPVYTVNRLLGMIPVVGDLLSGGTGQGVFAAAYFLNGPTADPQISVNPLAVLAPGFLRNLFFLAPGDPGEARPEGRRFRTPFDDRVGDR